MMAETARPMHGNFSGCITLRLNFRLKGKILRQYLWIVRRGNGYITTLLLEVFIQRNFVMDFILLKLNFIYEKQKIAF